MKLSQLRDNIQKRIHWFESQFNPPAIVVASHTPSMTILDQLQSNCPILGMFPPIQTAVSASKTRHIAVLGTQNLVQSTAMKRLKSDLSDAEIHLVDASVLIQSMEQFQFVIDPVGTDNLLRSFFKSLCLKDPLIDVVTLSSTHLSFLEPLICRQFPKLLCLDATQALVLELSKIVTPALSVTTSTASPLLVLVTESAEFPAHAFSKGLSLLGFDEAVEVVDID